MPSFHFTTTKAEMFKSFGECRYGSEKWTVAIQLKLDDQDEIRLASGEKSQLMQKWVHFSQADEGERGNLKRVVDGVDELEPVKVGLAQYSPAYTRDILNERPPAISFNVYLSKERMMELVEMGKRGYWPTTITISVKEKSGITYGWEPDGSAKEWDNTNFPHVQIEEVDLRYAFPLGEDETAEVETPRVIQEASTPVGADLLPTLKQINTTILWAFCALCGIVALLLFKR
jgi:hypothetical protein